MMMMVMICDLSCFLLASGGHAHIPTRYNLVQHHFVHLLQGEEEAIECRKRFTINRCLYVLI